MAEETNKYSLYDGREIAGPAIDWGTVAAGTAKTLSDISKDRLARRQKIEDDTAAAMQALSEVELGASTNMNTVLIDGSNASKETLSEAYDMVKRGLLSPKDFAMMMQKQKDGYTNLSTWAKSYNNEYQAALDRVNSGEAAGIEEAMRMSAFKFGNMTNKKLMSDPLSGELVMVDLVKNDEGEFVVPNYSDNQANFFTPQNLLNFSRYQQDGIVLTDVVQNQVVKNTASVIKSTLNARESLRVDGVDLKEITDFRQLFDEVPGMTNNDGSLMTFEDFLRAEAEGIGNSDQALAEILNKAGRADFKFEEGTSGGADIYVGMENGEPVYNLSNDQKEEALQIIENEINSQIDSELKRQKGFAGTDAPRDPVGDRERKKEKEEKEENLSYLEQINTLLTGDLTAANNEARDLIADFNSSLSPEDLKEKGIRGIIVTKNTIRIKPMKGQEYEVQRFEVDAQDQRTQRAVSEDALSLFNRIVAGKNLTKKKLRGYIDNEDIEFGDVREDDLTYRVTQTPINNALIQRGASPALDNKDPKRYIEDEIMNLTGGTTTVRMGVIENGIRDVIGAMIPTELMEANESMGYPSPLTSLSMDDDENTVTFSFGGVSTTMDFDSSRDTDYIYKKIEDTIEEGIKEMNKKRTRQGFDTQLKYSDWLTDTNENPNGLTSRADYLNWLQTN